MIGRGTFAAAALLLAACLSAPPGAEQDAGVAEPDGEGGDAASCPGSYGSAFGGSRYRLLSGVHTPASGQDMCAAEGAHLVVTDQPEENEHVAGIRPARNIWLGLVEPGGRGGPAGTWVWITGAELQQDEAPWDPEADGAEPDATGACAHIDADALIPAGWDDARCTYEHVIVCECDGATAVEPIPVE